MNILFLPTTNQIKTSVFHYFSVNRSIIKKQLFSKLTSNSALGGVALLSGIALGILVVNFIVADCSKQKDFQNRWKNLIWAGAVMLVAAGIACFACVERINRKVGIVFAALSSGIILGFQIQEYYNKNSDQKIDKFIQELKFQYFPETGQWKISLKEYKGCFDYFNLNKLGKKIEERFCAVQDALRINSKRMVLDLSGIDLTDDHLKIMADIGFFDNVTKLFLRDNPRLTSKGLCWIGEKGSNDLQELDLSGNQQLFKRNLDEWIGKEGFRKLTILHLAGTGITENELEYMIEKASWFRSLKGLNLDRNSTLQRFPTNILMLMQLEDHSVEDSQLLSNGPIHFHGSGIFCRMCPNLICTKEILKFAMKGKAFGTVNNGRSLNIKKIVNSFSLEQIFALYSLLFQGEELDAFLS